MRGEGSSVDISRREGGRRPGKERGKQERVFPSSSLGGCLPSGPDRARPCRKRKRGGGIFSLHAAKEERKKKGNFSEGGLTENFIGAIELAKSKSPAYVKFPLNVHKNNSHFHCLSCWQISCSFPFPNSLSLQQQRKGKWKKKKGELMCCFLVRKAPLAIPEKEEEE